MCIRDRITTHLGVENRKAALKGADFVVNAIQVGLYDPCTIIDFEVPKKYGLRQTIGDTLGIGGIMRALRTIPVLEDFARDIEEVCPDALFMNYTNPMAILSGYMQRYTGVRTVGLCHSVQSCSEHLLTELGMQDKLEGRRELIAGINHMAWLLELRDRDGNDLYPEIRRLAKEKNCLLYTSQLSPAIPRFLKPDGVYIVSGIIDTREADVQKALAEARFAVTGRREQGGWICLSCRYAG